MERCGICLKEKKKIKYLTNRINICKQCEELICSNIKSKATVYKDINFIARVFLPLQPRKPSMISDIETYKIKAKTILYGNESISSFIFGTIFDTNERKNNIINLANKLYNEKLSQFKLEMIKYTSEINNYELSKDRLFSSNINKIKYGTLTINNFERKGEYTITKKYFNEMSNTSFRLFRAYEYNIISDNISDRLILADSTKIKEQILRQDNYKCNICGSSNRELHLHHIIPLNKFGTDNINNMSTLCVLCHGKQHIGLAITKHKTTQRRVKTTKFYPTTFIAIDVETTGLDVNIDEIIEIAAVKFVDGQHTACFSKLVKPKIRIPETATRINNITNEMVFTAQPIDSVINEFLSFIKDSPLVAHNATFDLKFIKKCSRYVPIKNDIYDSMKLFRKSSPGLINYKLATISRHLKLNILKQHRAYEDALASGYIYLDAIRKFK